MTARTPSHEQTYCRLRDMILFGELAPGEAVTIQGLVARLGVGMTPAREALRRLSAEGALAPQGNRRITVPRLTRSDLEQLAFARLAIEPRLAELAAPALRDAATVAMLAATDDAIDYAIAAGDVPGYLRGNHRFHFTIYQAAGAGVLLGLARGLWLRFGPSLRVVCTGGAGGQVRYPDRHVDMLAALRTGNTDAMTAALRADIAQGVDRVAAALAAGEI